MELTAAQRLAEAEMYHYGLIQKGWTFTWLRAKNIKGQCHYHRKHISLSKPLTSIRDEAGVRMTILHEIAHALVGPEVASHGPEWSRKFKELGGSGTRITGDPSITREAKIALRKYRVTCSVDRSVLGYADRKGKRIKNMVCRCHSAPPLWITQN